LNYFGKKDGFSMILRRFLDEKKTINVELARLFIKPVVNNRDFLLVSFLEVYVGKFYETVFRYLLNLTGREFNRDEK
jgi:hypothetical protein